jgi:hypothetical protein
MRALAIMKQRPPPPLRDPGETHLQPLDEHPRMLAARAGLQKLESRLKQAERRQRVAEAQLRGQTPTVPITERAEKLLAGGTVAAYAPAGEKEAALQERDILQHAIVAKRGEIEALRGELSFEVCKQFAPLAEDALRAALDAVDRLFLALDTGRLIRGKIHGAGYALNENALPMYQFDDAAVLGDSRRTGIDGEEISPGVFTPGRDLSCTPAARFRAWLRNKGLIDG